MLRLNRFPTEVVDGQLQKTGDLFQEASGARSAFVIHNEGGDLAGVWIDSNGLGILSPDVEDGLHVGVQEVRAQGMAGDLGDDLRWNIRELERNAPIARAHDIADLIARNSGGSEKLFQKLMRRLLHVDAGGAKRRVVIALAQKYGLGAA